MYTEDLSHRPEIHRLKRLCGVLPKLFSHVKGSIWFRSVPLGVHATEKRIKTMLETVDADPFHTNTNLRRTAKIRLMEAGISQKMATKKTGRISEAADRGTLKGHREHKGYLDLFT